MGWFVDLIGRHVVLRDGRRGVVEDVKAVDYIREVRIELRVRLGNMVERYFMADVVEVESGR